MSAEKNNICKYDHCFETPWGTYTGVTAITLGGENFPDTPDEYKAFLVGDYDIKIYVALFNTPFQYAIITKQSFDSVAETEGHLEELLESIEITGVLRKSRYSTNIFLGHKTRDDNFFVL
ncbi:hypothetical protein CMO88_04865 [Candidatus Woesearchaeota archaeon]|nr:hypothetical protein [Candidatus Woesearchaeota archaeon]|tara:strand:- start:9012 stop:9371 length:360 start_codon:yes stop_codon:yes gene_type:complete